MVRLTLTILSGLIFVFYFFVLSNCNDQAIKEYNERYNKRQPYKRPPNHPNPNQNMTQQPHNQGFGQEQPFVGNHNQQYQQPEPQQPYVEKNYVSNSINNPDYTNPNMNNNMNGNIHDNIVFDENSLNFGATTPNVDKDILQGFSFDIEETNNEFNGLDMDYDMDFSEEEMNKLIDEMPEMDFGND